MPNESTGFPTFLSARRFVAPPPCSTPTGLRWGPAGSVGFTLATGVSAVTASSDLDLVLTMDDVPRLVMLAELREAFRELPARVDCQLDLPIGGVALDELLGPADRVLVRTADGPLLMRVGQLTP